jgi:tetratricopeptide (TPR) repeat protein
MAHALPTQSLKLVGGFNPLNISMNTNFTILILTALSFCTSSVLAQSKQYTKALNAYGRGSYVAARDHLQKIDRPDESSRVLLAKVLYQLSDYKQIEKVLSGLDHLDHDARLALATSYHLTEQYENARTLWKTLLDDDDQAVILSNIGDTFYNSGDVDSSLVYIEKALALEPLSDLYVLNLGITYSAMEQSGKACAHFFLAAQRKNHDAAKMYETENCISWQTQWLELVPGNRVSQLPNTTFPSLHQSVISINERLILNEHGQESVVTLQDIVRTDVGAVLTFRNDQEVIRRWVDFSKPSSFTLVEMVATTAGR